MSLRHCSSSHFISSIHLGVVKKVHNTDSYGRPSPKFKKLQDIYQHADAECNRLVAIAERKTISGNSYVSEENEPDFPSNENNFEDLTLSQLKKKCKRMKRKSSESVLLIPKAEDDDDTDLTEPLCKFRVKATKISPTKTVPCGKFPTSSRSTQFVISEPRKDLVFVNLKVEAPEEEYFEPKEMTHMGNDSLFSSASESGFVHENHELNSSEPESFTNEGEVCEFNEVSFDSLYEIKNMVSDYEESIINVLPSQVSEVGKEEYVNQLPSNLLEDDSFTQEPTTSTPDCSQSQLCLQQTPDQINHISGVQDSDSTSDSPSPVPDYLCLPWTSHSWPTPDDHEEDFVSMEAKSPVSEEHQHLTLVNSNADANSLNSDDNTLVSDDISILQDQASFVPANDDSEVKLDQNYQTDASEIRNSIAIRQPERLPLTRKVISPNSQEKLCQAMKSAESLDDMDHYKCKEKLYFGEQPDNKFSSTKLDVDDNEPNVHPQQAEQFIQNKVITSSKQVVRRPKNYKKLSPTEKCVAPKSSLDGPRLCRSLPRLSTGCTSIEGCSESAIAFSQRQMHDIETLASKLMSELNSMKSIVEEKMLYEAYRSSSLKNEADEVKSAIKSATKTEETAKRWLSMMARDCNRFCKIMKLNEDNNASSSASASADTDPALRNKNQEKPLQKDRKKISFADEAGGTLCDIKVFQVEQDSLQLKEKPQSSLV